MEASKEKAESLSKELSSRLGNRWDPKVWHNLMWCYNAVMIGIEFDVSVYKNSSKGYTCFLNMIQQFVCTAGTPQEAFFAAREEAQKYYKEFEKQLSELKD